MNQPRITALIPAFNEGGKIGKTIIELKPIVDEIIVIDDCSLDQTGDEAEQAGARVIRHQKNLGYIRAIKTGFQQARGEIVVTIDADGEIPVDKVPDIIKPILENTADMVQGSRARIPRLSERVLNWMANRKTYVGDSGTGFRALRTSLAKTLTLRGVCICGIFSLEVVSKGGRITNIPIQLRTIQKPRRIAWYHLAQFFYLFPWLFQSYNNANSNYGGMK